ncbi:alginate lyase domain-containing protein, partial [Fomitopsis betulina]
CWHPVRVHGLTLAFHSQGAAADRPNTAWTTCPYVNCDGKVNPDMRMLPDLPAVVKMPEAVLYNVLAYALQKTATTSKNTMSFIDTFFLAPKTTMEPNLNFGQMVVNTIQLLKAVNSPDWTAARDQAMVAWVKAYMTWLQTSTLSKEVVSKVNNHVTFYFNQITALQMYSGDTKGVIMTLKGYFTNQFQDQVATSGKQLFEAMHTWPFHYQCFNLEAMITNMKLRDQLGQNFWMTKSKYGATIQTALDYVMEEPKKLAIVANDEDMVLLKVVDKGM